MLREAEKGRITFLKLQQFLQKDHFPMTESSTTGCQQTPTSRRVPRQDLSFFLFQRRLADNDDDDAAAGDNDDDDDDNDDADDEA